MNMHFNLFVIPFCAGMIILPVLLIIRYVKWLKNIDNEGIDKIKQSFFSVRSLSALKEIFMECLIHRKVFKVNPILGYMHMSLAFGWFLLIVIGKIESLIYTGDLVNEIYYPVFFRFFELAPHQSGMLRIFNAIMDFLLLFIITGLILAVIKRFRSRITGLKKITKHSTGDRLALTFLWLIFPLRLLAESTTASYAGNGSFITQPIGDFLSIFLPVKQASMVFWWSYSTTLGAFLITIPYSRYMHIPTEIVLIFLRNWGFKSKENYNGFSEFELQSCSRCGICIDSCQMNSQGQNHNNQMVYFLRDLRYNKLLPDLSDNCLMCGRCNEVCPVGINLTQQRLLQRKQQSLEKPENLSYLTNHTIEAKADVVYFAGCMSHLSPSIIKAMVKIFKAAKINFLFLDENGSVCCGRPLKLSGQFDAAKILVESNSQQIINSGAKTLVTSCPICYKSFKEDYNLDLRIMHHSEFLLEILRKKKLRINSSGKKVVFHDPCELGRGSGLYDQPRDLLHHFTELLPLDQEKETSLCCGGSLGNLSICPEERNKIQKATADFLNAPNPDIIATACPMCKKSIGLYSGKPVKDLSELVAANLEIGKEGEKSKMQKEQISELIEIQV
jgi:Fe-S oxidoreductase